MPLTVLRRTLKQIYSWSPGVASIAWHGGEPLLATLGFFEAAREIQASLAATTGRRVANSVQTNGVLIDGRWAEFFAEASFTVGVSIDGPPNLHDAQRVDLGGGNTHRRVMNGVELLRRHGIQPAAVCVVHQGNIGHPTAVYDSLVDGGFRTFHFKALYERCDGEASKESVSGDDYATFLLNVFRRWATADNPDIVVGNFVSILAGLMGGRPRLCEHAGQCTSFVTIDWDGQIGACDAFPKNSFDFGNVDTADGLGSYRHTVGFRQFTAGIADAQAGCQGCEFYGVCAGGCFKYSYDISSRLWQHSAYCSSKKTLFRELLHYAQTGGFRAPTPDIPSHARVGGPLTAEPA
jgi:uncharacterized protein